MPPKRVDWLKDVPQQRTIVRRTPPPMQQSPYPQYGTPPQMPPVQPLGTFTGAGTDGIVQPGKMAGTLQGGSQVHEGEAVLPAGVVQNLTPEEFQAFVDANAAGRLDKNTFRQSIGLPPVQGFAAGTYNSGLENQPSTELGAVGKVYGSDVLGGSQQQTQTPASPFTQRRSTGVPSSPTAAPVNTSQDWLNRPFLAGTIQQPAKTVQQQTGVQPMAPIAPIQQKEPITVQSKEVAAPVTGIKPVTFGAVSPAVQSTAETQPATTTTTPAATTTQQQPVSALATENVRTGLQNLKDQMNGMTESDKRIANYYLTNTDANNAANIQVLANSISSDNNMSEAGKRMAIAGLVRDASSARATITQGLAQDAISRAADATDKAISTGQQVRQYEDVTLPAAQQALKTQEQAYSTQADTDIYNRISTLFATQSASTAVNDQTLRNLVKTRLGAGATEDQITSEIQTQWASFNESKKGDMLGNAENLVGYAIDNNQSVTDTINDQSIRRMVAGANGLDVYNPADKEKIDAAITTLYSEIGMDDVSRTYRNLVKSGIVDQYMGDTPDFEKDMKAAISDLLLDGSITTDGTIKDGADTDWPWNNPKTYFKYHDWSGNDIDVGTPVEANLISISGNGEKYKNANGQAVTNSDATEKWNSLSITEQDGYFNDDGTPNVEKFLKAYFPATQASDGTTVAVTTPEEYLDNITSSESFANEMADLELSFVSQATVTDDTGVERKLGSDEMVWYDEKGNQQIGSKTDGNLGYIWQQLSEKYGKPPGTLLTTKQFSDVWEDGEPWRVDESGRIVNLDDKGNTPGLSDVISFEETRGGKVPIRENGNLAATITEDNAKLMVSNWNDLPSTAKAAGDSFLESNPTVEYKTKGEANRWAITDSVKNWVAANTGKLYKANNGRVYVIGGIQDPTDMIYNRNKTGAVYLYDYVTGEKVFYSSDAGGGEERLLNGASYA